MKYTDLYNNAMTSYHSGKYSEAAQQFQNLINSSPNNAQFRNDLAVTYNKLGKYNYAIKQVQQIIYKIGDKIQYGAAYYNAGVAYEKKGNSQRALENYKLAVKYHNSEAKEAVKRMSSKVR